MKKQEVKTEAVNCNDQHCPFHSTLSTRGRVFVGNVIKRNVHKTATVSWPRTFYLTKYERYEKRRSKVKVHIPDCLNINVGDKVKIIECSPISKTKNFVIIEVLK
ncbi:MAG: 30S ribosomal protein S17 [Nanoarchaeota archaeon]|nr:30S ribosomal protein S17 [Nanoarchaeota archaeon]